MTSQASMRAKNFGLSSRYLKNNSCLFQPVTTEIGALKLIMLLCIRTIMLAIRLAGDLVVCHVNGARKYNLLCFSVNRLTKKYSRMFYIQNSTIKLNDFGKSAKVKMMIEGQ